MRQERTIQTSIFGLFAGHEIGRELKAISAWLDEHPALGGWWRRICGAAGSMRPGGRGCRPRLGASLRA
jgi:hypothetical protein